MVSCCRSSRVRGPWPLERISSSSSPGPLPQASNGHATPSVNLIAHRGIYHAQLHYLNMYATAPPLPTASNMNEKTVSFLDCLTHPFVYLTLNHCTPLDSIRTYRCHAFSLSWTTQLASSQLRQFEEEEEHQHSPLLSMLQH